MSSTIGVVVAMQLECEYLVDCMNIREESECRGFCFYRGDLHKLDVIVLRSGVGKVNAAIGTTLLMEQFQPSMIFNIGSAGGFGRDLCVGDLIIANELRYHDVDVTAFDHEIGRVPGMPAAFFPDPGLVRIAHESAKVINGLRIFEGLICSGDIFVSDASRVETIRKHFPSILACEMEAAAIAQTCYIYGCPFMALKTLSDLAGQDAPIYFDRFIVEAGKFSARAVVEMIRRIAKG